MMASWGALAVRGTIGNRKGKREKEKKLRNEFGQLARYSFLS